jgi:hypothetical protein
LKQLSSLLKISVSFISVFLSLTAHGSDKYVISAGAFEAGMGNVCIMKPGFWSSFQNQASLGYNNSFSSGFNYENRFGIKELATRSAGLTIPAGKASMGIIYSRFGYSDFKRDLAGLACGMKLSDRISAGVQVDYFSERTYGEYNNHQAVTFETGLIFEPAENIRVGIHLFNPVPNSLRKESLPSTLRIGAGTTLNNLLFAGAEAEISQGGNLIFRTGFDYEVVKKFRVRGGFSTSNNSFSFGIGYLAKIVQVDIAFVTHEKLGVTSVASLIFKIH